jgi:hypothetical protein
LLQSSSRLTKNHGPKAVQGLLGHVELVTQQSSSISNKGLLELPLAGESSLVAKQGPEISLQLGHLLVHRINLGLSFSLGLAKIIQLLDNLVHLGLLLGLQGRQADLLLPKMLHMVPQPSMFQSSIVRGSGELLDLVLQVILLFSHLVTLSTHQLSVLSSLFQLGLSLSEQIMRILGSPNLRREGF